MGKKNKKISINDNSDLINGFMLTCDVAKQTLGAEGKLGIVENEVLGFPLISKDGISLIRKVFLDNKQEALGSAIVKQAAARSLLINKDSTTTTVVLAQAIVENCKKDNGYFFNKKVEVGIEEGYKEVTKHLKKLSKKVNDNSVRKIATVSANGDKEIGDLVFNAYRQTGKTGLIDVIETDNPVSSLKASKGLRIKKGFQSPFLINNQNNGIFEAEDVIVVVYNGFEIHKNEAIINFVNTTVGKSLIIIAERVNSEDFARDLYRINTQGKFDITLIEMEDFDKKREALLEDVALYTGAEVFVQGSSTEVRAGLAKKVIVDANSTTIFQEELNENTLKRVEELKNQLTFTTDKEFFTSRISNIEGTSATILVGGLSNIDTKERYDRVDDSVGAIKSALDEGFISGGGSALVYVSTLMNRTFNNPDIQFGYDAIKNAIRAPFKQIIVNARRNPEDYIHRAEEKYGVGYNASSDEVEDLIKTGIIDSKKSINTALEQGKSAAILLMNINVVITF